VFLRLLRLIDRVMHRGGTMKSLSMMAIALGGTLALVGCQDRPGRLAGVETWMYQIQSLDEDGAIEVLADTSYPLLVLEPGHNFTEYPYDAEAMVQALRPLPDGGERLLVAYIDIGQAEDYRDYWEDGWVAPTATERGVPDFLVTVDPDGWSGNYPVAYWDARWKALWLDEGGIIEALATLGFDGIYLDWVEAYDDERVIEAAEEAGRDAADEMILFIEQMREAGQRITPDFLVIPQNAPYLIDAAPERYAAAIDALAVEDTWFHGAGDADWNDPQAGDLHERHDDEWSTEARLDQYQVFLDQGLPVFSVDYCVSEDNAAQVYDDARRAGLVPLVTRVSLSRLTETPPPSP
jgi:cysteinyl-tRNA synthetase